MEYVASHDNCLDGKDLEKKFGEEYCNMFYNYCSGGGEPAYFKNSEDKNKLVLTQLGFRHLHELRRILAEEQRQDRTHMFTIILGVSTLFQVIMFGIINLPDKVSFKLLIFMAGVIVFMVLLGFYITKPGRI